MKKEDEIVIVESYSNLLMAEVAKGVLESYGIESFIKIDVIEDIMTAVGIMQGCDLWVLKRDYQRAKKILRMQFKE